LCRIPEDNVSNSGQAASNDSLIRVLEKISKELVAENHGTCPAEKLRKPMKATKTLSREQ
jgi:hypothetical protein